MCTANRSAKNGIESVKMNIGADGLFSKLDARKVRFKIMLSSRSAQIAVALAATFVPAQAEAQGSPKPLIREAISQNATENGPPPIEIESSLSSGATWFGNELRRDPHSYGSSAQKLVASLFDGEAPKASEVEGKEMMKFLYELGVVSFPVRAKVNALTAPPEITAVARRFHSHMSGTARENPLVEVDAFLELVAQEPSTKGAIEALSGGASSADRAKLLLRMAAYTYSEILSHNRSSHLARREAANGGPAVGVGDGNEPVAASYLRHHISQARGTEYCGSACALMIALHDAEVDPQGGMLKKLAGIHSKDVGQGNEGIRPHDIFELMGYDPQRVDYTRVDPSNLRSAQVEGAKKGSDKEAKGVFLAAAFLRLKKDLQAGNRAALLVQGTSGLHIILVVGVTDSGNFMIHDPAAGRGSEITPLTLARKWHMKGLDAHNEGDHELYAALIPPVAPQKAGAGVSWVDMMSMEKRDADQVEGLGMWLKMRAKMGMPVSLRVDGDRVKVVDFEGEVGGDGDLVVRFPDGTEKSESWKSLARSAKNRDGSIEFGY